MAIMAADPSVQLTSVQAAIAAIEGGAQRYKYPDGTEVEAADLATLYAREKDLQIQINLAASGRRLNFSPVGFGRAQ